MRIGFRVDASARIGTGHLMRCLAFARGTMQRGGRACFLMANPSVEIAALVERERFDLCRIDSAPISHPGSDAAELADAQAVLRGVGEVDLLVVDHYALGRSWERAAGRRATICVIDDLADRPHECALLIDQNPYEALETRYRQLVPAHCTLLLGPRYAMLREEFELARPNATVRRGPVLRLLVFYGGIDATGETAHAIEALSALESDWSADVVIGAANPRCADLERQCSLDGRITTHVQTDRMAALATKADLALGAGGSAALERCYLGLPALLTLTADNQIELSNTLERSGAVKIVGDAGQVGAEAIAAALRALAAKPDTLSAMSQACFAVFGDVARRGVDEILDAIERKLAA